jgi:hypothetical protein
MGLNVQGILFGIKTASHVEREGFICPAAKLCGILTNGYGVFVHHTVKGLVFFGILGKILYSSKIITDIKVSAWLNTGIGNEFVV